MHRVVDAPLTDQGDGDGGEIRDGHHRQVDAAAGHGDDHGESEDADLGDAEGQRLQIETGEESARRQDPEDHDAERQQDGHSGRVVAECSPADVLDSHLSAPSRIGV